MEWNINTPSQWDDWDNLMMLNGGKVNEKQPSDWGIDNGAGSSFYSSGGSASDLGNNASSSLSASSSNRGTCEQQFDEKKDTLIDEPVIGLKLGRRTYFEDVSAAGTTVVKPPTAKKSRASFQSTLTPRCQVEGCNLDLTSAKDYHRRHRVCETHSKCPRVLVAGLERRFCQQCSRFHDLVEFDEKKRSCRRRLSDHNARRRKPQPETIHYNSARMSSSFYDGRQQMNLMFDRVPVGEARPTAKTTWQTPFCVKPEVNESVIKLSERNHDLLPTAVHRDSDNSNNRFFPFKVTTNAADVLTQGLEAAAATVVAGSNMGATPEFRRALSLLSNNPWPPRSGGNHPEPTCLDHLMHSHSHANHNMPSTTGWPQNLGGGSSDYWQPENQPDDNSSSQVVQMNNNNNNNNNGGAAQFQEFQLFKAPFEAGYYSSNHIN
ncbi:hypothetical protein ACHQM5_030586 [Ranunculus cassubicifolius]